jgi:hypothetical protein
LGLQAGFTQSKRQLPDAQPAVNQHAKGHQACGFHQR